MFNSYIFSDRLQSGMATGEGDSMAPDEMYLMLQADMVCIHTFFFKFNILDSDTVV